MKVSLLNKIFLEPLANFFPNWHRYTFGTIPSVLCIGDFDPIIKVIVLCVG